MSAATLVAKTPQLVTGDASGRIACWDLTTGTPTGSYHQERPVRAMATLPYGKLATTDGRRVRIWKAGKLYGTLEGSTCSRDVIGLLALPYGRLAAATAHEVRIWDVVRGNPLMTINSPGALITSLPDNLLGSYCAESKVVRVFNTESGARVCDIPTGRVEVMTALPNGKLVTMSSKLALWDASTGVPLASKSVDSLVMRQRIALTSNNLIVCNTRDSHFTVFDGKTLKTRELCPIREEPALHLLPIANGRVVTIDIQSQVKVWG
jgi:WD40 repeat protein